MMRVVLQCFLSRELNFDCPPKLLVVPEKFVA